MNQRRRWKAKRRRLEQYHVQRMRSWLGDHVAWWMFGLPPMTHKEAEKSPELRVMHQFEKARRHEGRCRLAAMTRREKKAKGVTHWSEALKGNDDETDV